MGTDGRIKPMFAYRALKAYRLKRLFDTWSMKYVITRGLANFVPFMEIFETYWTSIDLKCKNNIYRILYINIISIIDILFKGHYVQYFSAKFYQINQVTAMDYRLIIMFQNKIV